MLRSAAPLLVAAALLPRSASNDPLPIHVLDAAAATRSGAVCMDGTPPAFYINRTANPATANSWVLFFQGGGWCTMLPSTEGAGARSTDNCLVRSRMSRGSSASAPRTRRVGGLMDSDPAVNPTFARFNRVELHYCDGASWTGDAEGEASDGTRMHYRGKRILDAVLDELLTEFGLDSAEEVLVSGSSAGGLAAFLHSDFIRSRMPTSVRRFKAAPISGFFLDHATEAGEMRYRQSMQWLWENVNPASGVQAECVAAKPPESQWRCLFAAEALAVSTVPTFVINSAVDKWQLGNIYEPSSLSGSLFARRYEGSGCLRSGRFQADQNCTAAEIDSLNSYAQDFVSDLQGTRGYNRRGNAVFIGSCIEHSEALRDRPWVRSGSADMPSLNDALAEWWNSPDDAQPVHHLPCSLTHERPYQCQASCNAEAAGGDEDAEDGEEGEPGTGVAPESNPFHGVIFHWIGGFAAGSFYVPYKRVKAWSWETYWLMGGNFSWVVVPWLFASVMTNDLLGVLAAQSGSTLGWAFFFGVLWGLGGVTYGLTMRYLGISLGTGVALGYCAVCGTLLPPILKSFVDTVPVPETIGQIASSGAGIVTLLGVALAMVGIAIAAKAGATKEAEMPAEQKQQAIAEYDFKKGFIVATFCGIMSACFAFGLAAASPIGEASLAAGTPHILSGLPALPVVLAGGWLTNAIWCSILFRKNGSLGEFIAKQPRDSGGIEMTSLGDKTERLVASGAESEQPVVEGGDVASDDGAVPLLQNYFWCAVAGTTWYFQFFFYTMGETQMGKYRFASWTLHMSSIIITANLSGIALGEWKGASRAAVRLVSVGVAGLILATLVVGLGAYMKTA